MLLVAAALAGAAAGFLVYRHHAPAAAGLEPLTGLPAAPPSPPALATAATSAAPAAAPVPATPVIPAIVPDISLPDLAGKAHALRSTDGHPRLFNFWATWCEPCRREIPLLNTLQDVYAGDGLQIVGVAVDFRDAVQAYVKTTRLHYTSLVGEEDGLAAAQRFGMDLLLPFSVFADERNRIVAVKVGELHRDEADAILAQMRQLRAGRTDLPEAQSAIAAKMTQLALQRAKQSAPK